MNVEELKEGAEHAHHSGQKEIGLTMAVVAVLLAMATLLGHRAHTEEVLLQGKIVDDWSFYQAKHGRAHQYGEQAELAALLPNGKDVALRDYKKSVEEECGSPVEKGCASPLKDSPVIRALLPQAVEGEQETAKGSPLAEEKHEAKAGEGSAGEKGGKPEHKAAPAKQGAVHIQEQAREREKERELIEHRANFYDASELFLEISIVLCSISLLAGSKAYWKASFLTTAIGIGVALWGMLALH
jgi:Domain of unknown function (DUF4337)